MLTTLAATSGTFVDSYSLFTWDAASKSFTGRISQMDGFTGEHFDGEALGFGIEGKTGEVQYFAIVESVMIDEDHVDYWIVKPTSTRGRELVREGRIYNG